MAHSPTCPSTPISAASAGSAVRPLRIVYVVTSDASADVLLRGQLAHLRQRGFEVSLVCGPGQRVAQVGQREGVPCYTLPLVRSAQPSSDLAALLQLTALLKRLAPDVVNASTPKAALLGLVAAAFAGVPQRVYLLRGLRLETLSPAQQWGMVVVERLCSLLAHHVLCVSQSLRDAYVGRGLAPAGKCRVLGHGSSNGIDCARFTPDAALEARASEIARRLGMHRERPTLGFVGRPVGDKGIAELCRVFSMARRRIPDLQLLIVGAGFAGDAECAEMGELRREAGAFVEGSVADVAPYYRLMSLVVFPSYREGFPNVVLEASCMGLPVVGFEVTGVRDAVVHGRTGTLCPLRDVGALTRATLTYLENPGLRQQHGQSGARRVRERFSRERVWQHWTAFYDQLASGPAR